MKCPQCDATESSVLETITRKEYTRRRRMCPQGHRFTTYEVLAQEHRERAAQAAAYRLMRPSDSREVL